MKSYQEVVRERYDGREKSIHIYDNPYSLINPIGFYGTLKLRDVFYNIFNTLRNEDIDITKLKILDVGCGSGGWTRYFAEMIGSTENISGVDLSSYRIEIAQRMNSNIKYSVGDIVNLSHSERFDIVTAIDVFSHLNTEEEIISAIRGIKRALNLNGIFIWCEIYAKDHFRAYDHAEAQGYHPNQMAKYCNECGLVKKLSIPVFKTIWKYHTVYLCKRLPRWTVSLIEKLPGPPGNIAMAFRKI